MLHRRNSILQAVACISVGGAVSACSGDGSKTVTDSVVVSGLSVNRRSATGAAAYLERSSCSDRTIARFAEIGREHGRDSHVNLRVHFESDLSGDYVAGPNPCAEIYAHDSVAW